MTVLLTATRCYFSFSFSALPIARAAASTYLRSAEPSGALGVPTQMNEMSLASTALRVHVTSGQYAFGVLRSASPTLSAYEMSFNHSKAW